MGQARPPSQKPPETRDSGADIGRQLVLDPDDLIFQAELALLEPLHLQLVPGDDLLKCLNGGVEIPMLLLQASKIRFQFSHIDHREIPDCPIASGNRARWPKLCSEPPR